MRKKRLIKYIVHGSKNKMFINCQEETLMYLILNILLMDPGIKLILKLDLLGSEIREKNKGMRCFDQLLKTLITYWWPVS